MVPPSEEPELPIPSPAAQPPVIKLVGTLARIPEVSWFETAASAGNEGDQGDEIDPFAAIPPAFDAFELSDGPLTTPALSLSALPLAAAPEPAAQDTASPAPPVDPLAVIMLLSEEERIALFT